MSVNFNFTIYRLNHNHFFHVAKWQNENVVRRVMSDTPVHSGCSVTQSHASASMLKLPFVTVMIPNHSATSLVCLVVSAVLGHTPSGYGSPCLWVQATDVSSPVLFQFGSTFPNIGYKCLRIQQSGFCIDAIACFAKSPCVTAYICMYESKSFRLLLFGLSRRRWLSYVTDQVAL